MYYKFPSENNIFSSCLDGLSKTLTYLFSKFSLGLKLGFAECFLMYFYFSLQFLILIEHKIYLQKDFTIYIH